MRADRLEALGAIFSEAEGLAPAECAAFLDARCAGDDELRRDLEVLLEASKDGGKFDRLLDLLTVSRDLPDTSVEPPLPDRIGPYRVVEKLGQGGMGSVYLAERDDGAFEQRVALKLLRADSDSEELRHRFLAERQILARISHPNIARLLEGGVTPEGRPYFVMEYVAGVPIDRFCDERRLSVNDRLRLFRTVCAAVHDAHRHLVVHRDLKPANILVSDEGAVKLLDFGIAKPLDANIGEDAETRAGVRVLTPQYASPEQLRGDPVTTASDVYQLGVVLFELLTGHRPFPLTGRMLFEVERIVMETDPQLPSAAVHRIEEWEHDGAVHRITPGAVANARGTTPARLSRALQGDLDNIALKALRREPERRFASAERLGEDVELHQGGLPVRARPDTIRYRTSKFVRRNKVAVAAGVIGLSGVLAFAAGMRAAAARTTAERDKAEDVSALLIDLFWSSAPGFTLGDSATARSTLDRSAVRVRQELADRPESRARLLAELSAVYRQLGVFGDAIALGEEAIATRRTIAGSDDPVLGQQLSTLAATRLEAGRPEGVEALLEEAILILRPAGPEWGSALSIALGNLAFRRQLEGDYASADRLYGEVLEFDPRSGDEVDPRSEEVLQRGVRLSNRGWVKRRLGDLVAAEELFNAAIDLRRAAWGDEAPEVINSELALLDLLVALGDTGAATPLATDVLGRAERVYGTDHVRTAEARFGLANVLRITDAPGAAALYQSVLRRRIEAYGDPSAPVAQVRSAQAEAALDRGDLEEAERLATTALADYTASFGPEHLFTIEAQVLLGRVQHARGAHDEAARSYRAAIDAHHAAAADPLLVTEPLVGLGELLLASGDTLDALTLLREAAGLFARRPPVRPRLVAVKERLDVHASLLAGR